MKLNNPLKIVLTLAGFVIMILGFLVLKEPNQNKFLDWSGKIKKGTSISEVKKLVPENFDIDWSTMDSSDYSIMVDVEVNDFDLDLLQSHFYLEFDTNGNYIHGYARK
jgi:hypothetical protein